MTDHAHLIHDRRPAARLALREARRADGKALEVRLRETATRYALVPADGQGRPLVDPDTVATHYAAESGDLVEVLVLFREALALGDDLREEVVRLVDDAHDESTGGYGWQPGEDWTADTAKGLRAAIQMFGAILQGDEDEVDRLVDDEGMDEDDARDQVERHDLLDNLRHDLARLIESNTPKPTDA